MTIKKVALLIDAENVSFRYIPILMKKIKYYLKENPEQQLTHKLAFANWIESDRPEWEKELKENGIKQKHTPAYSKGKNGADISLVIYAMEAVFKEDIDTFILMTTDSDFTDLAYKLTEYGKKVIICGNDNTSISLKNSGESYWELTIKNKEKVKEEKSKTLLDLQKTFAIESFKFLKKEDSHLVDMSLVYSRMVDLSKERKINIDYKKTGHKKLRDFFVHLNIFNFESKLINNSNTYFVSLK